jgi:PBP1b-binding outer membrane lipoprotein LpoB
MKKILRMITPLILAILLISACAPQIAPTETEAPAPAEETQSPVDEPAQAEIPQETAESEPAEEEMTAEATEAAVEEEPFPYTDEEMEALITEKADGNHSLSFILNQNNTREEWEEILDRMIGYGAQISPEEKERIITWLLSRQDG